MHHRMLLMKSIILMGISSIALLSAPYWSLITSASAATFAASTRPTCRYLMEGPIETGDLDKLKSISQKGKLLTDGNSEVEMVGDEEASLCLNSPGGSFIEGLALAKFVSEVGIATVIDEGQECFSACALLFMAGRTRGNEEDYVNRKLHYRGLLGFHRPYLTLPNEPGTTYTATNVNDVADVAVAAIAFLLSLGNEQGAFDPNNRIKPSLIEAMLRKGRDDLEIVDTVDEAGRWDITIFGYTDPSEFKAPEIYNACANFIAWRIDQRNDDDFAKALVNGYSAVTRLKGAEKPPIEGASRSFHVAPGKDGYLSVGCTVNVHDKANEGKPSLSLCATDGFTGVNYGDCYSKPSPTYFWVNSLYTFPPQTKLIGLPH